MNAKSNIIRAVIISVFGAVVSGCATSSKPAKEVVAPPPPPSTPTRVVSTQETVLSNVPAWFLEPQASDGEWVYVVGTGVSRDLSMSLQKARLEAQSRVAESVEANIDILTKSYKNDTGPVSAVTESTEVIVRKLVDSIVISKGQMVNKVIVPEGNAYRAYVKMRYPIAATASKTVTTTPMQAAESDLDRLKSERAASNKAPKVVVNNNVSADNPVTVINNVPTARVAARPLDGSQPGDTGIIIRGTRATESSAPLGVDSIPADRLEEN